MTLLRKIWQALRPTIPFGWNKQEQKAHEIDVVSIDPFSARCVPFSAPNEGNALKPALPAHYRRLVHADHILLLKILRAAIFFRFVAEDQIIHVWIQFALVNHKTLWLVVYETL